MGDEGPIRVDSLLAGLRVGAHDRMVLHRILLPHRLPLLGRDTTTEDIHVVVGGGEPLDARLPFRGEAFVGEHRAGEAGVSADGREDPTA